MKKNNNFLTMFLIIFVCMSFSLQSQKKPLIKNVIFFIGDGMGNQQRRIAAIVEGKGNADHRLVMEKLKTSGIAFNHSADKLVTDSAAAGTALATGYRTNYKMISMTPSRKKLKTILEACKEKGKSCGIVSNTAITHATPACFASHVKIRYMEETIATHFLDAKVDVILGGGRKFFLPTLRKDNRNLLEEFKKAGYQYVMDKGSLHGVNKEKVTKLLGLFAKKDMAYEIDRNVAKEPSILDMTKAAIDILKNNPKGFFLMVEGGKIDWANHGHDVAASVHGTLMLDKAISYALNFAKKNNETLIIVVNDHETGGMVIGKKIKPEIISRIKSSSRVLSKIIKNDVENARDIFETFIGLKLTNEEYMQVVAEAEGRLRLKDLWGYGKSVISEIVSKRSGVLFATTGHSGGPVIIAAEGPGCEIFDGFYDITEIPRKIAKLLSISFP